MNSFREKIVILVLGPTKSGKSTFINTILGENSAAVSIGLAPCTEDFKEYSLSSSSLGLQGEFDLTLIDTPGFTQNLVEDMALVDRLKLRFSHPGQKILHPIIYLHDISTKDIKLSYPGEVVSILLKEGLPSDSGSSQLFNNLILGTIKWDRHPKEQHKSYDAEIRKTWRSLVDKGARIYHLHESRSREAALALIGSVLPRYELIICVVGPSGSGKSTFINKLLQSSKLEVGHGTSPCTQEIRIEKLDLQDQEIGSRSLSVVDTPGLDGMRTSERSTPTRLCVGFLYLHDISSRPMDRGALGDFMRFKFTHLYKQSTLLVMTNWIDPPPSKYLSLETEIKSKHWRLDGVSRTARFLNTYDSAKEVIRSLIKSIDGE